MKAIITIILSLFVTFIINAQDCTSLSKTYGEEISLFNAIALEQGVEPVRFTVKQFRKRANELASELGLVYDKTGKNNIAILHYVQCKNGNKEVNQDFADNKPKKIKNAKKHSGCFNETGSKPKQWVDYNDSTQTDTSDVTLAQADANTDGNIGADMPVESTTFALDALSAQPISMDISTEIVRYTENIERVEPFKCTCELEDGLDSLNKQWMSMREYLRKVGKRHEMYDEVFTCMMQAKRLAHTAWGNEMYAKRAGKKESRTFEFAKDKYFGKVQLTSLKTTKESEKSEKKSKNKSKNNKPHFGGSAGKPKPSGHLTKGLMGFYRKLTACKKASKRKRKV